MIFSNIYTEVSNFTSLEQCLNFVRTTEEKLNKMV